MSADISAIDETHLRRCVELATQSLENGDDPFGSVLADADGLVLAEALNREATDADPTAHPELELVQVGDRPPHPGTARHRDGLHLG